MVHFVYVHGFAVMFFSFVFYVFTGSNVEKMPLEKRDSIISEKKISPNGQGLYDIMPWSLLLLPGQNVAGCLSLSLFLLLFLLIEGKMKFLHQLRILQDIFSLYLLRWKFFSIDHRYFFVRAIFEIRNSTVAQINQNWREKRLNSIIENVFEFFNFSPSSSAILFLFPPLIIP